MLLRFDGFEKTYSWSHWDYVDAYYFNDSLFTVNQDGYGTGYRTSTEWPHYSYEIMNTGFGGRPMLMYDFYSGGGTIKIGFYWRARPALGDAEFFTIVAGTAGTYRKVISIAIRNGSVPSGPTAGAAGQLQVWSCTDNQTVPFALQNFKGTRRAQTAANFIDPLQWYLFEIVFTRSNNAFEIYVDGELALSGTGLGPADSRYAALRWESYGFNRTCFDDFYMCDTGSGQVTDFVTAPHVTASLPNEDVITEWTKYGATGSVLYTAIDDRASGAFDGIETGTPGRKVLFKFQNSPIGTPVYGVLFKAQLVQKENVGGSTVATLFGRINGQDYDLVSWDVPYDVRQTYSWLGGYYIPTFPVWLVEDPRGGPWQYEDFIGGWRFGLRHDGGQTLRCTALMMERFHEAADTGAGARYISY